MAKQMNNVLDRHKEKILNKAIFSIIGDIGIYQITDDGKLVYEILEDKLEKKYKNQPVYDLVLPSADELKSVLHCMYKIDFCDLNEIEYKFKSSVFSKKICINSDSNILISGFCKFNNGIVIEKAKKVIFSPEKNYNTSSNSTLCFDDIFLVNADYVELKNCTLVFYDDKVDSKIEINAKNMNINSLNILSSNRLDINSEILEIYFSNFKCPIININAGKIYELNNKLQAKNSISINDKSCDELKNVFAPLIIYNGIDITNSEGIKLPQVRQILIAKLNEILKVCNSEIEKEVKDYEEGLKKRPISIRLKNN